ncbi:MAG: hypothetical protein H6816_08660 [Phycisphaerales bacterium]|nr:hypothetical protein [Phycisphaerales bacterium]
MRIARLRGAEPGRQRIAIRQTLQVVIAGVDIAARQIDLAGAGAGGGKGQGVARRWQQGGREQPIARQSLDGEPVEGPQGPRRQSRRRQSRRREARRTQSRRQTFQGQPAKVAGRAVLGFLGSRG